jgi:hypothetical protein
VARHSVSAGVGMRFQATTKRRSRRIPSFRRAPVVWCRSFRNDARELAAPEQRFDPE